MLREGALPAGALWDGALWEGALWDRAPWAGVTPRVYEGLPTLAHR